MELGHKFKVGDKVRYTKEDEHKQFQNMVIEFIDESEWPYNCFDKFNQECSFYEWELELID